MRRRRDFSAFRRLRVRARKLNTSGLYDYQKPAAAALLAAIQRGGAALDASDCGVGKTAHAVAVIRELNLPTLVVCPKVSIAGWRRMGERFGTEFEILNYEQVRTGNTPFGAWQFPRSAKPDRFKCEQCQLEVNPASACWCPFHPAGIHCVGKPISQVHNYGRFIWHPNIRFLAFDEAHRCAGMDSLNADMVIAARRQRIPALALSATVADSPLHLRALGYLLGLHDLVDSRGLSSSRKGFYQWAFANGCRKLPFRGLHFCPSRDRQSEILHDIHSKLFPFRGCRICVSELGDAFPDCQITAELYDVEQPGRMEKLQAEMQSALLALSARREGDEESPLVDSIRQMQEIELLMVPVFVELANDAIAEGLSVAVFLNYRASVEEVCARLKTDCKIIGEQKSEERQANVDAFQRDEQRVIVATGDAGGVSIDLHDVRGQHARLGLVSLPWSARSLRQIFGRLRRSGGKSKALYRCVIPDTEWGRRVHKAVSAKLNRLDLLNDADLMPAGNLPLTNFSDSATLPT